MKEFNENPFAKDTPVSTFSSGNEAQVWQHNNCHQCVNYDSDSKTEEEAKCKLAFHIDMGYICGEIPLWACKEIGIDYDPLYQSGQFRKKCRKFNDGDPDMPF